MIFCVLPFRPWPTGSAILISVLAAGLPTSGAAAAAIDACARVEDDHRRLLCYDRISGRERALQLQAGSGVSPPASGPYPDQHPYQHPDQSRDQSLDQRLGSGQERDSSRATMPAPSAADAAFAAEDGAATSLLDRAWSFGPDTDRYLIKLYRPNYLNPIRYQSRTNDRPFSPVFTALENPESDQDNLEAAFQISFKTRVWASRDRRLGFWFAYTQRSFWQVYNSEISSPFRDTNYMPELMLAWRPNLSWGGFDWRLLSVGYNHESNGRADPISRSWDRLIAEIGIERDDFALLIRPWIRIDDESSDKDNPDITDYYGWGDVTTIYKWRGSSFTVMVRGNPAEAKGTIRATWMTPNILGPLRGYLVAFSGYGDTLIDYNFKQNAISVGIALNDLLDR